MKRLLLLCAIIFLPYATMAQVANITVSPSTREVGISGNSTVVVTWQVSINSNGGPRTLVGQAGTFKIAGNPVATSSTISRPFNFAGLHNVNVVENIRVPRHVILQAQREGAVLQYERFFADDSNFNLSEEVALVVTSGAAGEPSLAGQTLTFDDGSDYRSVAKGDKLHARAEITVSGSGMLRAVWEIADNFGGTDQPFYRPLQNVTRPIGANNNFTITSPELPTKTLGRFRVRLRQIEPATDETLAAIDYFVTENGDPNYEKPFEPKIPAKEGGGIK